MSELAAAQAALSVVRGRAEARPDCERTHVAELEQRNRALLAEIAELKMQLRNKRTPVIVRRVCA